LKFVEYIRKVQHILCTKFQDCILKTAPIVKFFPLAWTKRGVAE